MDAVKTRPASYRATCVLLRNMNKNKEIKNKDRTANSDRMIKIIFCYILTPVLLLAVVGMGIWGKRESAKAEKYRSSNANMYERAYTDLVGTAYDIRILLSKLLISESPATLAHTLNELSNNCAACTALMAQLPSSHVDSLDMEQFIIRLGDYADSLSVSVMKGKPISDDDRAQLASLYDASGRVYAELKQRLDDGTFPMEDIGSEDFYSEREQTEGDESGSTDQPDEKYPTLIYDGPFAESTEKSEPKGLTGEEVDESTAFEIARKIIGENAASMELATTSEGRIASYDFAGSLNDGRSFDIAITKRGGHLLWLRIDSTGDIEGVPDEDEAKRLVDIGKKYLETLGFESMEPTYAQNYSGIELINFAWRDGDIIVYNDMIKVSIDRSSGEVCGIDTRSYLFSHTERTYPENIITEEEARQQLSINLTVTETNLTLIPATAQTEKLCYEFKSRFGEDEYAVYLDAETGEEVKIFRIISDENGQLAI